MARRVGRDKGAFDTDVTANQTENSLDVIAGGEGTGVGTRRPALPYMRGRLSPRSGTSCL